MTSYVTTSFHIVAYIKSQAARLYTGKCHTSFKNYMLPPTQRGSYPQSEQTKNSLFLYSAHETYIHCIYKCFTSRSSFFGVEKGKPVTFIK